MTAMRRYDPFRELATLQERMNRIFDDTLSSASRPEYGALAATGNGLLVIELPKREEVVPKSIRIRIGGTPPIDVK